MHPDLLRVLAKARHDDLLNRRGTLVQTRIRRDDDSRRFLRSRRRVGSLLIWAGARLMGDHRDPLELAHE